jgi:DNA-binding ferritin-like protein
MRINSVSQNDAISKYINNVNTKPVREPMATKISDSVELSENAQKFTALLKAAKEALENASTLEDARTADIMAQIKNNNYDVPVKDVIDGILNGYPTRT